MGKSEQELESVGTSTVTAPRHGLLIPMILGVAVILVIGAVGLLLARKHAARSGPVAATAAVSRPARTKPASAGAALAAKVASSSGQSTRPEAKKTAAAAVAAVSKTESDSKGGSEAVTDKVEAIAAKYENNPKYQIRVGASPVSVRATKPINLYIPPHDPMYDISKHTLIPSTTNQASFVQWMVAHSPEKNRAFLRQKWRIAQIAVSDHAVTHRRVLDAFLLTPREWFVRQYNYPNAYERTSLPIGYGQTITNPGLVIRMTNALDPQPNQKVLEIGTGSGYQSAFLSELSNYVYTVEIVRPLGAETNQIYLLHTPQMPQYANIHRRLYDGYYGWPKYAPFDRIIVTTGIDHIPPVLLKELKPGGIMLIPVGPPNGQTVLKITKTIGPNGHIHLKREDIFHGFRKEVFVPFTASGGGTHNAGSAQQAPQTKP